MKILKILIKDGLLNIPWWIWLSQGCSVVVIGLLFTAGSLLNTEVAILSTTGFSWLAILGILIIILGILDCIDAIFSKEICDYMQRMNAGVLDIVFGSLLLFGISDTLERLSLMIALYLFTRSILRTVFAIKLKVSHLALNFLASVISLILGVMIWQEWPAHEGWFFSFSLSIDLVFRGLLMIFVGLFIKNKNNIAFES